MNRLQLSRDSHPVGLWRFLSAHWDILIAALAGLLTGLLLIMLGPTLTAAILLGIVAVFVLFKLPEYAILVLLLDTSGLLPAQFNPSINLFVGHFQLSDLMLIALLAVTALRLVAERKFKLRPTPLYLPLILFCLTIVGGMITAVVTQGIPFSHTTYEARILLYYAVFFAVVNLIRTPQQIYRLVYGIFAIGILVGTLIVLQVVLGFSVPVLMPAYFKSGELMRAYHPGYVSVMMTIMSALCLVALRQMRKQTVLWWWAVLILLGLSLLVSLGRNVIVSLLFALGILILLLRTSQRARFLSNLLALVFVAVAIFSLIQLVAPAAAVLDYPKALFERFARLTTTDPLSPEETILWRVKETRFAIEHLLRQPLLGIGLETEYRPPFFEGDTLQSYIHNGYLWLWLKTGLAGLVSFLWLFAAFLARGFRHWKTVRDDFLRPVSLGFTLVIVAMLLSNFIAPLLVSTFSLVFFGVGMGIVEVTRAVEQETAPQKSAE